MPGSRLPRICPPITGSVLVGFRYWTDVAVVGLGFMVDDIAIPEQAVDGAESPAGWNVHAGDGADSA